MHAYRPTDVFAVNEGVDIQEIEFEDGDKGLIIDSFYKYPDRVRALCKDTPAPIWKNLGVGKNGDEYWDCRHQWIFYDELPFIARLASLIEGHYRVGVDRQKTSKSFTSNIFQWNVDQPKGSVGNLAHYDGVKIIAANIYLNTEDERQGGTAIYRSKLTRKTRIFVQDYMMRKSAPEKFAHLAEDGASYYDINWRDHWELDRIIEMKYNRVAIYPGYMFHGAYHIDNAFRHYPRITQTYFVDCLEIPNEKTFFHTPHDVQASGS